MAFWSRDFSEGGLRDPKRKFRFTVEFSGFGEKSFLWWAKTANKPSFTIESATHNFLNHTFYYPGTVAWADVEVTLVDPTDPDMAASFSAMVEGGGYHPPSDSNDLSTMTKSSAASSLGKVTITQIDHEGDPLESWELYNAWISGVKYGDLEYGSDDITEIGVTLKYDWAKLTVSKTEGSVATADTDSKTTFFAGPTATS